MPDHDFLEAVIEDDGKSWPVRLSAVIPVQYEVPTAVGIRVDWHLDLGISRADPERMEWRELDDLIQGNPSLKFRINGKSLVDVSGWFGETRSRIGNDAPDITLDVDLAWHDLSGPVESVEAVWVVGSSEQSLGHLTVHDTVVEHPAPDAELDDDDGWIPSRDKGDTQVEKLKKGLRVLKAARVVFVLGGLAFAVAGIAMAFHQAPEVSVPAAVGIAAACLFFGVIFGAGAWLATAWFMQSAQDFAVRLHGPQFEEELTGRTDYWNKVTAQNETRSAKVTVPPELDLNVDLTATVVVHDIEETLTLTAAHLFIEDDLRGNVDVVVSASPAESPNRLTEALLEHLQLGFDGRATRLRTLAHRPNDPDGSFLVVLCYSVTDLIGEFDQPRLERWIDEFTADPGMANVYWDDRLLGTVRLVIAD